MNEKKGLYGHVGRPSNEEVNKVKNKKIFKGIVIFFIVAIFFVISFILFNNNMDFSSLMGNSTTSNSTVDFSKKISNSPILSIDTKNKDYPSNALQGAAGESGYIYFSLTSTAANNDNKNPLQKVNTKVYYYNMTTKNVNENKDINNYLSNNTNIKINDVVFNSNDKKAYYISHYNTAYYENNKDKKYSKILRRGGSNNGLSIINTIENTNNKVNSFVFYNIGYSISYDKYVSVGGNNKVYFYNLNKNKNGQLEYQYDSSCKLSKELKKDDNVNIQGITVRGKLLYVAYQIMKNKIVVGNYFDAYDMRNCFNDNKDKEATLIKQYSLGVDNIKYELENLFFIDGKLYLGYNNDTFDLVSFYTADISNKTKVTASVNDNTVKAKISNSNGILYYSLCTSKKASNCKFKSFSKKEGKDRILFNNSFSIKNVKKGTYYVHTYDIFGKYDRSNAVTVK